MPLSFTIIIVYALCTMLFFQWSTSTDMRQLLCHYRYYILSVGSNSIETSYSMQDELRHVLSVLSEDKAKHLDIRKTKEVFIDQRSTAQ